MKECNWKYDSATMFVGIALRRNSFNEARLFYLTKDELSIKLLISNYVFSLGVKVYPFFELYRKHELNSVCRNWYQALHEGRSPQSYLQGSDGPTWVGSGNPRAKVYSWKAIPCEKEV